MPQARHFYLSCWNPASEAQHLSCKGSHASGNFLEKSKTTLDSLFWISKCSSSVITAMSEDESPYRESGVSMARDVKHGKGRAACHGLGS